MVSERQGYIPVVRRLPLIISITAFIVAAAASWKVVRRHIPSDIEYQGQKIKLSKYYLSFEDYKDDPDNIDPSESARVARLVREAPIAHQFADRNELVRAIFEIKFPGYGLGSLGESPQPDGSILAMFSVEIPRANENRYWVFEKYESSYKLANDFTGPDVPGFRKVRRENGALSYTWANGGPTLTRPLTKNAP